MSNPGPLGAPGPVSVKVRQKVNGQIRADFWARALGPSNPGGLAAPPERPPGPSNPSPSCSGSPSPSNSPQWRHSRRHVRVMPLARRRAPSGIVRRRLCCLAAHCAAAELRLLVARVAGVGSTAVLCGWMGNVACERVWLLVVVCTNICRSIRKVFVQIGGPTHPRPFIRVMNEHAGMQHSALALARWECAMSSKSKRVEHDEA
jgi:hypothetical protein